MSTEMQTNHQRHVALFLPYRIKDGALFVYLQKRTMDAPRAPGFFGLFGGGVEQGETPEQAFLREVEEELSYRPRSYRHLGRFDVDVKYLDVYVQQVETDFEARATVREGEYGRFFSEQEVMSEEKLSAWDKNIIMELYRTVRESEDGRGNLF